MLITSGLADKYRSDHEGCAGAQLLTKENTASSSIAGQKIASRTVAFISRMISPTVNGPHWERS